MSKSTLLASAAALTLIAGAAMANTTAHAVTDLNLRAGPGPQYPVIDVIARQDAAEVEGCLDSRDWCRVSYQGATGWAYGEYLTASLSDRPEPIVSADTTVEIATVTYENEDKDEAAAFGGVAGAVAGGAIVGGPIGAVAGAVVGAAAASAAEPDSRTVTYVQTNKTDPVYLEGEVVAGARLPEIVALNEIPDSDLVYAYVNGVPVLVDPERREIVHVVH